MSLLEDVFLQDEAGEAQELERVIEGYEDDERPQSPSSDENEEKEDEAEEDKRRVDPTQGKAKRVVKNPRFLLNPARLTGPRGIQVIPDHFKDFKFKGKGHEKEDLDMVLKKLEHWAYRLYPKFEFGDCLKKIETLGKKRPVMVHLRKIRSDQITSDETVVQKDSSDDELPSAPQEEDEFDKLLQQQIELARSTPMSVKKPPPDTPSVDRSLLMPKAVSSPSINDEQRERMLKNRRMAEERRLAKLNNESNISTEAKDRTIEIVNEEDTEIQNDSMKRKHNRTNVIDSSSDDEEMTVNQSIAVEVHSKNVQNGDSNFETKERSIETVNEGDNEILNNSLVKKHNRTNVIDSSSDDEEITMNQSIAVEVHSKIFENEVNTSDTISNGIEVTNSMPDEVSNIERIEKDNKSSDEVARLENNKADDKFDTLTDYNIEENNAINIGSTADNSPLSKDIVQPAAIENNAINVDSPLSKETAQTDTIKDNEDPALLNETKKSSLIEESSVNTKVCVNNDIDKEIMDVDFDDDF
ncbi:unnamed protein product [Chilo suppressalis]|uniref:TIMELESS-interacting protein n=1 Tax=Chilo suppressalis TaxID=168631 RepID=A0ABN8B327_CHISP|nr:unnamed protein product [Chilo suppressalis]